MLVPMVFALHYPKANHGAVHLTQGLVVPLVRHGIHESRDVDPLQVLEQDIEMRRIRVRLCWLGLGLAHTRSYRSEIELYAETPSVRSSTFTSTSARSSKPRDS